MIIIIYTSLFSSWDDPSWPTQDFSLPGAAELGECRSQTPCTFGNSDPLGETWVLGFLECDLKAADQIVSGNSKAFWPRVARPDKDFQVRGSQVMIIPNQYWELQTPRKSSTNHYLSIITPYVFCLNVTIPVKPLYLIVCHRIVNQQGSQCKLMK